jgi:putative ABC transport system permease protein
LAAPFLHYVLLAVFAVLLATPIGIALAWVLTRLLLDIEFSLDSFTLAAVDVGAIAITGLLGATTIIRAVSSRPAQVLGQLGAE